MQVSVRRSPLQPPLFTSTEATWLDIRDQSGFIVFLVIFPPGGSTFITISKNDPEFAATLNQFGVKLQEPLVS